MTGLHVGTAYLSWCWIETRYMDDGRVLIYAIPRANPHCKAK